MATKKQQQDQNQDTASTGNTTTATENNPQQTIEQTQAGDQPITVDTSTDIRVNVTGKLRNEFTATAGATLRRAFIDSGKYPNKEYENMTFSDENGKVVSLDRKLTVPLKLTAIAKVNGG